MILLNEKCSVERPVKEVFAYACEFSNCAQWDATALSSDKIGSAPTGVGTEYDVVCAMPIGKITLRYKVLKWEPDHQVVLEGTCPMFTVTDTIMVTGDDRSAMLDYTAEFKFTPALRPFEAIIKPGMVRMGATSVGGLQQALEDNFEAPTISTSALLADKLVLPGLARFSKLGYLKSKRHWHPMSASMDDKHIVLTGATSGIGLAAARELAKMGAGLTLVARDESRGASLVKQLIAETGNDDIALQLADMSVMEQVQQLVERLIAEDRPIDVLINNAGALFNPRQETAEGLEKSFALLLLGPYLLTEGVLPLLQRSGEARVVNVVSGGMYSQKLVVDQLQSEDGQYSGSVAYARAKRGLMVKTEQWARDWQEFGISCNAMHPGWADTPGVETALPAFHKITKRILRTPEQGADTIVWLAAAREAGLASGKLFLDREPHATHFVRSTRESAAERSRLEHYLETVAAPFVSGDKAGTDTHLPDSHAA